MPADRWNIAAGELGQQIVIQTATVGAADSRGKPVVTWPDAITVASWLAGVATITIAGALPATFKAGVTVVVSGMKPVGYNGTFTVVSVTGASTFTVAIAGSLGAATAFGSIACDPAPGTLVRCKVETPSGRKLELSRQLVPTATHLVTMRYRPINENTQRLVYKLGRVMNIGWPDDVGERHIRLELTCTELKP